MYFFFSFIVLTLVRNGYYTETKKVIIINNDLQIEEIT